MYKKRPTLTPYVLAGVAFFEVAIPYAQWPFKDYEPNGPEQGECSLPIAHTAANLMGVWANIVGARGTAGTLYSEEFLTTQNKASRERALRIQQDYNVRNYVRITEEMPAITVACYPSMITTVFSIASTEVRAAVDGRMVNYKDYYDSFKKWFEDSSEEDLRARVNEIYLPLAAATK